MASGRRRSSILRLFGGGRHADTPPAGQEDRPPPSARRSSLARLFKRAEKREQLDEQEEDAPVVTRTRRRSSIMRLFSPKQSMDVTSPPPRAGRRSSIKQFFSKFKMSEVKEDAGPSTDLSAITDEEKLHEMMNATEDFEERKAIRSRLKEIREEQTARWQQQQGQPREDPVLMRQRMAQESRQRQARDIQQGIEESHRRGPSDAELFMRERQAKADLKKQQCLEKYKEMGPIISAAYGAGTSLVHKHEQEKQQKLESDFGDGSAESVTRVTSTDVGADGKPVSTTVTTTKQSSKDGNTTVTKQTKQITQVGGVGGTQYTVKTTTAEDTADQLAAFMATRGFETCGVVKVRTESWNSVDGSTRRQQSSQTWNTGAQPKPGARGARAAFKEMDKNTAPPSGTKPNFLATPAKPAAGGVAQRSPSAIKQMLLDWTKAMTSEYPITIKNFSSSWNNGMAFCALIHHFHPEAFDFNELKPENRRHNFTLAFDTAEKYADIAPLLEVDDMVRFKNPDYKCVFTYVQSFYRRFRNHEQNAAKEEKPAETKVAGGGES